MEKSFWPEVRVAAECMQESGIILYPTDTIWGLGCNANDEQAIAKIFRLKQREDSKSLIILIAEPKDIFQYVADPPPDIIDIIKSFEDPTTIIYQGAIHLPDSLIHVDGTIAIRVTKDPFCKALIKKMQSPLVSTSANISGHPSPVNFGHVESEIKEGVDYIVNYRQDEESNPLPSRILKFDDQGQLIRIR